MYYRELKNKMNLNIKNIAFLFVFLCVGFSSFSQKNKKETTRILFIFDGSNSMNSQWQKSSKIKVAKKLMYETMDELSHIDNLEVALRMYGHQARIRPGQQDCSDTKLEVPFGKGNFDKIKLKINSLIPKGTTPIARSLEAAAKDFSPCDNCRNVIVLITDGIEACDEDPCAVAKMLREKGIEVRPYVIGIAMDIESLKNFQCIGKSYDASTEESFKSVMKVVMSEALNNTTLQVNLLNSRGESKETDVVMTFSDVKTGEIRYTFTHTMNRYNRPDTMTINPLTTYNLTVHTTPEVVLENVKLKAGEHNSVTLKTPQGGLELRLMGARNSFTKIKCIVRESGKHETINAQNMNTSDKYLVGKYDIEILTLPIILMKDIKIEQSKTKTIKIQQPGAANIRVPFFGETSIFTSVKGKRVWVCNLDKEKLSYHLSLQPGVYTIVYRASRKKSSAYTVNKEFKIVQGLITDVAL